MARSTSFTAVRRRTLAMSFKYSRTASLAKTSSALPDPAWFSYLVFGRLPSGLEDLDALLTKVLLHVHEEGLHLFGAEVFQGKPPEKVSGGDEAALPALRRDGLHGLVQTGRLVSPPFYACFEYACFEANIRAAGLFPLADSWRLEVGGGGTPRVGRSTRTRSAMPV
jgi:hypothetical protein